jgi:uncharacterized protein YkwD
MPAAALAGFAVVATTLGLVVAGPLTVESQPGNVLPSVSPVDEPQPEPAVTASPADVATAAVTELFDAPDITVVPPPPPPPTTGSRRTGGGTTTACFTSGSPYQIGASDPSALLTLVNLERERIGLGDLTWSGSLASDAQTWSEAMAAADDAVPGQPGAFLAHWKTPSPGGQNVATNWTTQNGTIVYDGLTLSVSLNYAHEHLMYSQHHCENILRSGFTTMGAGGVQSAEGVWYWTENFQ